MNGLNKYQQYIIEAAYKNAVKDKPNTNTLLAWYEESGDIKKRVDLSSIWLDADYIPETAPELDNGEKYVLTVNNAEINVLKYYERLPLSKVLGSNNSFKNELLIDSIESSYGSGYVVKIYDGFFEEIPFGLSKWVVDPCSGILSFIEGVPEGYAEPFYISFYKYIGRKGNEGLLTSDGKVTMLPGYTPNDEQSVVTKGYVDSNVTDLNDIVKKLIPNTPETFKNKDLEIISNHRKGSLVTTTDPEINVFYTDDRYINIKLPQFWNEDSKGFLTIQVNGNDIYKVKMEDLTNGVYNDTFIHVDSVVESYPDNIVADDFYKSINASINLDYVLHISPYINNPNYPIFSVNVKWHSNSNATGYSSNPLLIGLDKYSKLGIISDTHIFDTVLSGKFISGVPAMVKDDAFKLFTSINTLKKFKKLTHGHLFIEGLLESDIETDTIYSGFNPLIEKTVDVSIPDKMYSEKMHVNVLSYNLDDEINCEEDYVWNIRTDSVSNESNRVTSPDDNGLNYGKEWDLSAQKTNLSNTNELQMLNGKYQWPRGDYTNNGKNLPFLDVWGSGPNYDDIDPNGVRYVTFKYYLNDANGFYFEIDNQEGIEYNPTDFTFTNIESLKCKIDGKNDWLDMNAPFDGVLSPYDFDNKGCLVVNRSNVNKRYCTFGTEVLSGNMYITLGIRKNLSIKLSGISVFMN